VVNILEHAREVLKAALKYDMTAAVVFAETSLASFIQEQPLRVFAIACQCELEALALRAAQEAVAQEVVDSTYIAEYDELPAGCYHRLLQYQREVYDATPFIFCRAKTPISSPDEAKECPVNQLERDAPHPFDNPDADTTIVSADRVRFRVHSFIIMLASPRLKSMLETLPAPHDTREAETGRGSMSIIHVNEDSKVLQSLLSLCYPLGHLESLVHIDSLPSLLAAAEKYQMERATWFLLQRHWSDFATEFPLRSYLFASSYEWKEQAMYSAKMTLTQSLEDLQTHYEVGLETTVTGPYYHLLQYHRECGNIAERLALEKNFKVPNPMTGSENEMSVYDSRGVKKKKGMHSISRYGHQYKQPVEALCSNSALECFGLRVEDIGKLLSTLPSTRHDLLLEAVENSISKCPRDCGPRTSSVISSFRAFEHTLDDEIAKVDLKMLFQKHR